MLLGSDQPTAFHWAVFAALLNRCQPTGTALARVSPGYQDERVTT
jgi:hypothetical protein